MRVVPVFQLGSLSSKELFKDVFVRIVNGLDLTLNYFELKNKAVKIPFHEHPVEHLVIVLEGVMKFMFDEQTLVMKKNDCIFVPARKRHTACVIEGPIRALEIYNIANDEYYKR